MERVWAASKLKTRRIGPGERRLSFAEREQISRGVAAGKSARAIARELGRAASTITRELEANGGRRRYRALRAHERAIRRLERPKPRKLEQLPRLRAEVEAGLEQRWSPQQISARLRAEHPDDPQMQISHETIYQSLFVQCRGQLRRELTANLRTGRVRRRSRGGDLGVRGRIRDMVMISERPAEIEDRAVPGHWEGDLLVGKGSRSFIATLVERQTRYVLLARLGTDKTTAHVVAALQQRIAELPAHLLRSLTWDQGVEMAGHQRFSVATGIPVYFCDPHSPWQRGSNENTNGLLRQYLPKATDLSLHTQDQLDRIAIELNGRPRQTLGWKTPAEKMQELLLR
ncbi:MAG TPA: IS30 family transposase [Baekduia sp.]|nr:IS30 family transposase [Baekduia sp.]